MSRLPKRVKLDPVQASAVEKKEALSSSSTSTSFTYDAWGNRTARLARQIVAGSPIDYEYTRRGRLVKEGDKTYTYGYLDKVLSVSDGKNKFTYTYHPDGWNALAYCNNGVMGSVDLWGCVKAPTSKNNMFQEDIANIDQYKAKLAKAMEEVNSQGWTIDKPHYIDNLLYYCNIHVKE